MTRRILPLVAALSTWLGVGLPATAADEWEQFLDSPTVFGDYSESEFTSDMADKARPLIRRTCAAGTTDKASSAARRRAARSLWAGVNLEYQAFLSSAASTARERHAAAAASLSRMLREFLDRRDNRLMDIEREQSSRLAWQDALLRLEVIEQELAHEVGTTAPELRIRVRQAVLQEFEAVAADGDSPNGQFLRSVGRHFQDCRDLAAKAAAAITQASLVMGKIYGYSPDDRKKSAITLLHPDEQADFYKPPQTPFDWETLCRLILRSYGGGERQGIVGLYGQCRQALQRADGTILGKDILKAIKSPDPSAVTQPYKIDKMVTAVEPSAKAVRDTAPVCPKEILSADGKAITLPEGKFAGAELTGVELKDRRFLDGHLGDYLRWFESRRTERSRAFGELLEVQREIRTAQDSASGSTSEIPVDEQTFADLTAMTRVALGKNPREAEQLVRSWLNDWIRTQRKKVVRQPDDQPATSAPKPGGP